MIPVLYNSDAEPATQDEDATVPLLTAVTGVLLSILLAVSMKQRSGKSAFLQNASGVDISGGEFNNVSGDFVKKIKVVNNPTRNSGQRLLYILSDLEHYSTHNRN